ncbi:MAG: LysM peptidoglycan-binding domain-containing protein [Chloroflexi bacterium]|nr:LysM peptidoglycan-binding domain-containing protein [Chloroflexota bacterium]
MSQKNSAQNVIQSYRKRQQMGPFIVGGAAILLVIVGLLVLVLWLTGPNAPSLAILSTKTPTATSTYTSTPVTPTSTPTITPTETLTPTMTVTPTPSGPFKYQVQEGDTCWDIAQKFQVDLMVLLALNNFPSNECPIKVGDEIYVPAPDQGLPTPTALPTGYKGEITYTVMPGDTLAGIAYKFYSTEDAIMAKNKITDKNKIYPGDKLIIPVNIATRVPTRAPTSTPNPLTPTVTPKPGTATPTGTATRVP